MSLHAAAGRAPDSKPGPSLCCGAVRFSVQLPTEHVDRGEEFLSAGAVAEMARAAEDAGFDACFVTDHPAPPARWLAAGGHHALDPFVALAFAAAATTRIRLQTNVLVLPYRNPFLMAKAAATLDVLSGGRLILGVAAGYLEAEFRALGVPFEERNERADEALAVMRRIFTEEDVHAAGRSFAAEGHTVLPQPLQRPGPPVWVGGNSRRAIRRAVELGDGWLPFPAPAGLARHVRTAALASVDDLRERITHARAHAERVGREAPLDVAFVPFGFELGARRDVDEAAFASQLAELAAAGVTWCILNVACDSRAEYLDRVAELGALAARHR
jgi:probable F420-dependent oxidoreductase